jgi:hypothetical protein
MMEHLTKMDVLRSGLRQVLSHFPHPLRIDPGRDPRALAVSFSPHHTVIQKGCRGLRVRSLQLAQVSTGKGNHWSNSLISACFCWCFYGNWTFGQGQSSKHKGSCIPRILRCGFERMGSPQDAILRTGTFFFTCSTTVCCIPCFWLNPERSRGWGFHEPHLCRWDVPTMLLGLTTFLVTISVCSLILISWLKNVKGAGHS